MVILGIVGLASRVGADVFRVVALPDTQGYSQYYPSIFLAQTNWVKANASNLNIVFVTHLGDVVEHGYNINEWNNALKAMQVLDGVVPYGLCPGNHDIMDACGAYTSTNFVTYFGPDHFAGRDWYGGASPSGMSSWQKITAGGYDLMFLHLALDAPDDEIAWARSVLTAHPGVATVLVTHEYLGTTTRLQSPGIAGRNSAEAIWNKLIRQYDQIFAVLCGHIYGQSYNQTSINNSGRKVYEMLSDYQNLPYAGNGYLRILTVDTTARTLSVQTYSPKLNQYMSDSSNQFTLALDPEARFGTTPLPTLLHPQVVSDFNIGGTRDGWVRNSSEDGYTGANPQGDSASTLVRKSDTYGRGYLYYTEAGGSLPDYFIAPQKFRGDLSGYDAISLDYHLFVGTGQLSPTHLRLYSGTSYYEWRNTQRVFRDGQWMRLVASLTDPDLWTAGGGATSFNQLLRNVTEVRVFADVLPGTEATGLDNFALCSCDHLRSCAAISTFDNDTDGWTVDPGATLAFDVRGCISGTDSSPRGCWYFNAPAKFLGDKSAYYSCKLQYDLKQDWVDNQFNATEVELSGAGTTLYIDVPQTQHPDSTWATYSFVLDETGGWINRSTALPPTEREFRSVLSNLTGLRIRGKYRTGWADCYLDNVIMAPDTGPVITQPLDAIADIKCARDGAAVSFTTPKVVTVASGTFSDGSFYIEEPARFAGVKVVPGPGMQQSFAVGDRITGLGVTATDSNGERYVILSSASVTSGAPPRPVGTYRKTILGSPSVAGLLVTVWGRVVYVDPVTPPAKPAYVYVDDGSGRSLGSHIGTKIVLDGLTCPITKDLCGLIAVTGVVSMGMDGAIPIPVIRPRGDSDIVVL